MAVTDALGGESAPGPDRDPADSVAHSNACARHNYRARFWRLALGGLGLFWVAAFLLLAR